MIELHQLRIFVLVAEKKSFSEAAEAVLLSQPTVSSHIKHLEETLGTPLFDRLPRSVELTPAGEILYRHSREILRLSADAVNAVQMFCGRIRGLLEVGASTMPGEYILPGLLSIFKKSAPEVEVRLRIGDSREITTQVMEGSIEAAVVGAKPKDEVILSAPFCRDTLVLIVPSSHPLARGRKPSIPWRDLLAEPLWMREPGSGTRQALLEALARKGKGIKDLTVIGQMGSTEALKQAVAAGTGAAVVSSLALGGRTTGGGLAGLSIEGLHLERSFFIIRHAHRTPSPAAALFLEFLNDAGRELSRAPKAPGA